MNKDHLPDNCRICGIVSMEKKKRLAELGKIVSGKDGGTGRMASPVLPRYKYGMVGYRLGKTKAASSKPNRIILHPERVERNRLNIILAYKVGWN